jgi:hypothetical protein
MFSETDIFNMLEFLIDNIFVYEVCLIRIKEQVGEKRSTVGTHRYADCLLKNTYTKYNKYVVNQKLEHVEDISFREHFGRIRVVFYKIRSVSS